MTQPMTYIRKKVLATTQTALAVIAGTTQATVSRWETGEFEPNREQMERIRAEVARQGKDWDDRWFFEVPSSIVASEAAA